MGLSGHNLELYPSLLIQMSRSTFFLSPGVFLLAFTFVIASPPSVRASDSNSKPSRIFKFGKRQQNSGQEQVQSQSESIVSREVQASSPTGGEGSITIPMADYKDLMRRLDSLEKKVAAVSTPQAPSQTYTPSSPTFSYDGGKAPAKAPAKAVQYPQRGGFYADVEYVNAKPVFAEAPAFFIHDNLVPISEGADEVPFDPDLQGSVRFELGYLQPAGDLGWRARYWFFDGDDTQRSPNNVDVKIGVADDPDIAVDDVGTGTDDYYIATMRTELDVLDLDMFSVSSTSNGIRRPKHRLSGVGLRLASIQHNYDGQTISTTGTNGQRLTSDHDYSGVGPSVYFETTRPVGNTPLYLNVKSRGGLLFGRGDTQYLRFDSPGTGTPGDYIRTEDKWVMVPVVELQAGVGYELDWKQRPITIEGGVEAQAWFNGGSPIIAGQDSATDSDRYRNAFSTDMGFIGYYFKVGMNF